MLSLPNRLRKRLGGIIEKFDFDFETRDDYSSWSSQTSAIIETEAELRRRYGVDELEARDENGQICKVDLKGFIFGTYPSKVLDAIEFFFTQLPEERMLNFQNEINLAFEVESSPWRLSGGQFFQVDSTFIELNLIAKSYELLKAEGFDGALNEFNEARNNLSSGDTKGAIVNACKSFESVLKTILSSTEGNASTLIRNYSKNVISPISIANFDAAFGESVLMSVAFLRNRLGGHGQGETIQDVPKRYANLAINLTASLNLFLIESYILATKDSPKNEEGTFDEDIPF
ncbi:DUF7014 domain-containing protein [Geothrix fermentans]|uniref:DUF7014 domain-containing protein n=1 Tax=Geothrix fermentans TaxID=44676 RepID=UPI0012FA77EA|nr:hypothetical protein [Geothrix fermentans]